MIGKKRIDKGNTTAGAIQVKANLQEHRSDHLHFRERKSCKNARYLKYFHMFALAFNVAEILTFLKCFICKKLVMVMEYNCCIGNVRWHMSKSTKDSTIFFALALIVLEILKS